MKPRSITVRLSVLYALVATIVLLGLGWYLFRAVEKHFAEEDITELTGKLELVRHLLAELESESDIPLSANRFRDALVGHHSLHIMIRGADGKLLFALSRSQFPQELIGQPTTANEIPATARHWRSQGGEDYRWIAAWGRLANLESRQVLIFLALDASLHRTFLGEYRRSLVMAILASAIATTTLGWGVTRRALRPVRDMASAAQSISASRLGQRLRMEDVPDELKQLAGAFNAMLARLEDSFERLSDFSSNLAHELRTPINNLMGQTHVALSRARTAEQYRNVLESNVEEYERLARMIADMLFLAKADHGQTVLQKEELELSAEVARIFEFYEALADDRHVVLVCEGHARVVADRIMVQRAISNLLSNAIGHTPPDGAIRVVIASAYDGEVSLAVSNPGPDIPPEGLPKLFDRFYRVDSARGNSPSEGFGLGLAIVKSIMQAHGGDVSVTSAGGLTTFILRFPGPEDPHRRT